MSSRRFHAVPDRDYDSALGERGGMAKFKITFTGANDDEEVEADYFQDNPPFVDFMVRDETSDYTNVVAR